MRTGSPISPVARPTATLVALALALASPVTAHAQETLPTPVRVEGTHGPVPLAVPPDAPPPVLYADTTTTVTTVEGPSSVALAQGSVTLRDGRVLSGTLVQVHSGQQVILDTPDAQRHIIPWDQVADLRYAAPAAVAVPVPAGPGRPTLHVELTRPGNVRLYEVGNQLLVTPNMNWGSYAQAQQAVALCTAPCDRVIDASRGQSYFFAGDRITPSRRFTLDEHDGPMLARVRPGRVGVLAGGILFTSLSVAPLISGTLYLALSSHVQDSNSGHRTRNAGIALTSVGVGMLVTGIIMLALGRTRVELYRRYTGAAQRRPKAAAAN